MSSAVADVLRLWRRGERVLDALAPFDPDHEIVRNMVARLNATYQDLTDRGPATEGRVARSRAVIEEAEALLVRVQGEEARRNERV